MRKSFFVSTLLAVAMGCAAFGAVAADGGAWQGHRGTSADGDRAYAKLDLSDAQRSQIRQLTQPDRAQARRQTQALRHARQAYESATPGSAQYQAAANALAQAEADAARERVTQRANLRAQIYQVLTPAQRSQLAQMRDARQARMQQWKQFQQENPLPQSSQPTTPSAQ